MMTAQYYIIIPACDLVVKGCVLDSSLSVQQIISLHIAYYRLFIDTKCGQGVGPSHRK